MEIPFVRLKLPPFKELSIDRITVERLDFASGMARIETVPMQPKHLPAYRKMGPGRQTDYLEAKDQLALWDLERREIRRLKIRSLRKKLMLGKEDVKALSENMVFWRIHDPSTGTDRVFHATASARALSKTIYAAALRSGRKRS